MWAGIRKRNRQKSWDVVPPKFKSTTEQAQNTSQCVRMCVCFPNTRDCTPCYFLISAKLCLQQQPVFSVYSPALSEFKILQQPASVQLLRKCCCRAIYLFSHINKLTKQMFFFQIQIPFRNKYQFCQRNSNWNCRPYVRKATKENRAEEQEEEEVGGEVVRWRCGVARASVYSQTRILNMADLALDMAHREIHAHSFMHTETNLHNPPDCCLQPLHRPSRALPLCRHRSFWTRD